ncbi:hypothetical protein ASD37_28650 [Mycobacterium sp. Root135]|nr:hypothetical protein ASD37_28650 [Mycobacterium sp. Root135]
MPVTATTPPIHALPTPTLRAWSAVTALALAVFVATATEMMPVAVLSEVGADLGVSVGAVGLTVTVYGVMAGLSAPLMTAWTRRVDRRTLVSGILGAFVVGNVATAVVSNFPALLAVRLGMGLFHGLMWSIVAGVAVRLVPPASAGRATAAVFSGISLALVLGVPAGTAVSARWGWHAVFAVLAAMSAASMVAVAVLVPRLPAHDAGGSRPSPRAAAGRVRTILVVTALVVVGNYAGYTFIAPFLFEHTGIHGESLGVYLLVYGVAGVMGNVAIGVLVGRSRSLRTMSSACLMILTASLVVLCVAPGLPAIIVAAVALWGAAYSALPVMLQTLIFAAVPDQRDSGTALYVMVFNVAIAGGSLVGAVAIDGFGASAPIVVGAFLCAAAAGVALRLPGSVARPG